MTDLHSQAFERVTPGSDAYLIDGLQPETALFPEDIRDLSVVMTYVSGQGLAVAPWGGGVRMTLGNPIRRLDAVVDLSRMQGVVAHNPGDLTLTVESGIPVEELQAVLAEHGQFLPLDPPIPHRATIGGTLASGAAGPLKAQYGNLRDLVIGMKIVQADGTVAKSGGEVVKNVSGYDMARLHVGGLGTLGVIAEVSFKLTPLPRGETTLVASFDTQKRCLNAGLGVFSSHVVPYALTAFDGPVNARSCALDDDGANFLAIRLGGRPLTLERQLKDCSEICRENGARMVEALDHTQASVLWRKLADFGWDDATTPLIAGRATLLPTEIDSLLGALEQQGDGSPAKPAVVAHPGYGSVMLNWFAEGEGVCDDTAAGIVAHAREAVHDAGGRMVIERCPASVKSSFDVWDDVGDSLATMRRFKEQYDPKAILNPGRFAGGI